MAGIGVKAEIFLRGELANIGSKRARARAALRIGIKQGIGLVIGLSYTTGVRVIGSRAVRFNAYVPSSSPSLPVL